MTRYSFGDVLLLVCGEIGAATIKRPAIVLYDSGTRHVLVCAITGKPCFMHGDFKMALWREAGLLTNSYVRTAKAATFPKHRIDRKLGKLMADDSWWLKQVLRRMLDV